MMGRRVNLIARLASAALAIALAGSVGAQEAGPNCSMPDGGFPRNLIPIGALPETPLQIKTADGAIHHLRVEVAETSAEQQQGMMFRESSPDDRGMLFLFECPRPARFWMRNTLIPLDMVFIAEDRTILRIHHEATPCDLTGVESGGVVSSVLEIRGGLAAELGLSEGDAVVSKALTGLWRLGEAPPNCP